MSNDVGKALLILQPFRHFTYVSTHSPTLSSLHLRHNSFSNPSFASPTSQLMIRAHSTTFPSLRIRLNSFSNPSVTSPTSQFILQPFRRFTYVSSYSPTLPSLHLRHSSFPNPSVTSPTSQHMSIAPSPTLLSLLLRYKLFTYVTWRAAHVVTTHICLFVGLT